MVQSKRRFALTLTVTVAAVFLTGCTYSLGSILQIPAGFVTNVGGWDLSACSGHGLGTCTSLFVDNQQQLLNGSTAGEYINEGAVGFLSSLSNTTITLGSPSG